MEIVICTYGRVGNQLTYKNLPPAIQKRVRFAVQAREVEAWNSTPAYKLYVLPANVQTIQATRQHLITHMGNKLCMLDDDLVFYRRRTDDPTKFTKEDMNLVGMFDEIEAALDHYAHVGVSHREGANRCTDNYMYVNRMMRILAYRCDILKEQNTRFDRLDDVEDFDVCLQLLQKGYPNKLLNLWCHNQAGSNHVGGCSTYRTPQLHADNVRKLAQLNAPFVKVVKKTTKDNWCADENGERTDANIQWKKAYTSSGQTSLLDQRKVRSIPK